MPTPPHIPVQEGYDRWSEVYDSDGNPLFVLEEPVVRNWLSETSGKIIADVGCGTGRHTVWLAEMGANVLAFDFSDGMMERARNKVAGGNVLFCRHELPSPLPLRDKTCHHILFSLVGDHIEHLADVFAEFRRVLVPGGSVVFTTLHPAMNLAGVTARFRDPGSGEKIWVRAFEHSFSDYVMGVVNGGLTLDEIIERKGDDDTAQVAPRAAKYLGIPMLLAIKAIRPTHGPTA